MYETLRSTVRKGTVAALLLGTALSTTVLPASPAEAHTYGYCGKGTSVYSYHGYDVKDKYYKAEKHNQHWDHYYYVYHKKYDKHGNWYWQYNHTDKRHC